MVSTLPSPADPVWSTCDERAYVVSSAKMHLSMAKGRLQHLIETSSVPKDLADLVLELQTSIPNRPTKVVTTPKKPLESALRILTEPRIITIDYDHVATTFRGVLTNLGDSIVVFAYADDKSEAIAYNPRNGTAGRLPANLVNEHMSQSFPGSKMYVAISDIGPMSPSLVGWKEGYYIRIWDRRNEKGAMCSGFCFVLATGRIGKFSASIYSLKALE